MPTLPAFPFLIQGLLLGLTAAASPGPFQTFMINQALTAGWRRGAQVAFAPLLSDGPIILLVLLVLDQLPGQFLRFIGLGGGIFVFYLAWGLWKQWRKGAIPDLDSASSPQMQGTSLWRGVLMNMLSPGPYTFWTLVNGPLLLSAIAQSWWHAVAFLLGFYGVFIGSNLMLVLLFFQARRLGPKVVRGLILASIVVLVVFGGILIFQAVFRAG